jgi:hypothetical protein
MACSRSHRSLLSIVLSLGAVVCAWSPRPARAAEQCLECHLGTTDDRLRLPAEQMVRSVHRADAIGCVGCHGGDPADDSARAHASELGFIGRPSGEQGVVVCGGCHADALFVRRTSATLRTDQLALFRASRHGELAAVADPAAPDCISCHGSHDVLPGTDPRSRVHPLRVSELCGSCHADSARLAGFRTPTTAVTEWERSAHAVALREGKPRAPTCTGCHGAHADAPAGAESAARACGSCHEPEQRAMDRGVHAKPFVQQGLSPCVPCHGAHDVQKVEPLLLGVGPDGACGHCHPRDDPTRAAIEQALEVARAARDRAAVVRARAARPGSGVQEIAPLLLGGLDSVERELGPAIHDGNADALVRASAQVDAEAGSLERTLRRIERDRRIERAVVGTGLALLAAWLGLLVLRARRARRRAGP